jgi:hypothetical protein
VRLKRRKNIEVGTNRHEAEMCEQLGQGLAGRAVRWRYFPAQARSQPALRRTEASPKPIAGG